MPLPPPPYPDTPPPYSEEYQSVQPYDFILFIGPNHSSHLVSGLCNDIDNTHINHLIIGDGARPLTEHEIATAMQYTDEHTQVHYWAHGSAENGTHQMRLLDSWAETSYILSLCADKPCARHVWSCYAGTAKESALILGNAPLTLHSGENTLSLTVQNATSIAAHAMMCARSLYEKQYPANAYELFINNMYLSPETSLLCETHHGVVQTFKYTSPPCPLDKENLLRYFEHQAKEFLSFQKNDLQHPPSKLLNKAPQPERLEPFFTPYIYDLLDIYIDRNKTKEYSSNIQHYAPLVDITQQIDNVNRTYLYRACQNNDPELVSFFLEQGCNPAIGAYNIITPLLFSVMLERTDVIEAFLTSPTTTVELLQHPLSLKEAQPWKEHIPQGLWHFIEQHDGLNAEKLAQELGYDDIAHTISNKTKELKQATIDKYSSSSPDIERHR